jgi:hypothetical protein
MNWRRRLAPLVSTVALAWCVFVGFSIWFTPVKDSGISGGVPSVHDRSFADVSRFGSAPLVVPVLIAAFAGWSALRGHRMLLGFAAFLLAVFTFISGFSIGGAYLPADGLLLLAVGLAALLGSGRLKSAAA